MFTVGTLWINEFSQAFQAEFMFTTGHDDDICKKIAIFGNKTFGFASKCNDTMTKLHCRKPSKEATGSLQK